jgi:cytochrome P450
MFAEIVGRHSRVLTKTLGNGGSQEITALLRKLTFDVMGEAAFGVELGVGADTDEGRELSAAMMTVMCFASDHLSNNPLAFLLRVTHPRQWREFTAAKSHLERTALAMIRAERQRMTGDSADAKRNLLQQFVAATNGEVDVVDVSLTDSEVTHNIVTVMFAAFDTIVGTLGFALEALATADGDVMRRVRAEVDAEFDVDSELSFASVSRMKYLVAAVKESQRLRPVAFAMSRGVVHDVELGGFAIPRGSTVLVNVYHLQRSVALWGADAEQFRPERFLNDDEGVRAYFPFGAGGRVCIGRRFAEMQVPLIVAYLVRHFSFEIDPSKQFREGLGIGLVPKELWLKFTPRRNSSVD